MTASPPASTPLPRVIAMSEFEPLLGKPLLADCDPQPVALELVEVTPLRNFAQLERAPFILVFRSPPEALLMDGHYVMRGDGFGPDLVTLSRIAPPGGPPGHYYQAVFN